MQRIGRGDIDATAKGYDQVGPEAREIEQAPAALEFYEKIYVATVAGLAAGDGTEQTRMHDPVSAHWRRHFPSDFLDGWAHGVKSTPGCQTCPRIQSACLPS
jgi:hypothetical protein